MNCATKYIKRKRKIWWSLATQKERERGSKKERRDRKRKKGRRSSYTN
jgi:hypothetical protein